MDFNSIISDNLKFYDSLESNKRENNYTVIATINELQTGKLLALATGTQANLAVYPDDIEDCHAESLLKRAYKRYLINNINELLSTNPEGARPHIRQLFDQQLVIFISQFPCGFLRRYQGQEPIDEVSGEVIKRKPGRGQCIEGKTIYVQREDCFTKLQKWVTNGLQGQKLKDLLNFKSKIGKIIIGDCESDEKFDYQPHIIKFQRVFASIDKISIDHVKMRRDEFVFEVGKQPQAVGLVWWSTKTNHQLPLPSSHSAKESVVRRQKQTDSLSIGCHEILVDGRKIGLTKKQCISNKRSHCLKVGDYHMKTDIECIREKLNSLSR